MTRFFRLICGACFILITGGLLFIFPRLPHATTLSIRAPLGTLDSVTDSEIRGWACDPDRPDASIPVYVFQGPKGAEKTYGKYLGLFPANQPREQAVQARCNSSTADHGFVVQIPPHNPTDLFYVYAQNIDASGVPTGGNPNLSYSPRTSALLGAPSYR